MMVYRRGAVQGGEKQMGQANGRVIAGESVAMTEKKDIYTLRGGWGKSGISCNFRHNLSGIIIVTNATVITVSAS